MVNNRIHDSSVAGSRQRDCFYSSQMSEEPASNGTSRSSPAEPDADTIKMFVGQIPRQWNEPECRKLFEKYGPVYSLNILRDKNTQQSKGCCFVTYYHRKDAINAQGALHNIEVIEGMHHPIQMKPADTENRNERKLFIGQLSKKQNEDDVRQLFTRFGHIEDVSVLRDADGRSRGCAFVTFATRNCAVNATKEMHHSQTMEGCTAPLVVKFADSQKERDTKGAPKGATPTFVSAPVINTTGLLAGLQVGQQGLNLQTLTALAALIQPNQQNVLAALGNVLSALGKLSQSGGGENVPSGVATPPTGQPQSQQPQQPQQQQLNQIAALLQQHQADPLHQMQQAQLQQLALQLGQAVPQQEIPYGYAQPAQPGFHTNGTFPAKKTVSPVDAYMQQYAMVGGLPQAAPQVAAVGNGETKGPEGSNLFIYHLPQDFGDSDLLTTFSPFGNVLSAKVFIDKVTSLSKCFGFISYDNALSAQNAIAAMNGFQIGSKRLKVQLKNERTNPYTKV